MTTYRLPEQARAALLTRKIPADRPLDAWPQDDPEQPTDVLAAVRSRITREVQDIQGWTVVDTGLDDLVDDDLCSAVWNLFTTLCRPVPQYRTGELIYPVEVSGAPSLASSHYSSSNRTGGFHTDGTLLDAAPHVAMLAGLSSADEGGETVLVDAHRLVDTMDERTPELLSVLEAPQPFHSGDSTDDPVMLHPVISRSGPHLEVHYLRRYIEQGHGIQGQRMDEKLIDALETWDELIAEPAFQQPVLLERGQVLLWDNRRFVHGRTPFTERLSRRRLRRAYGVFRAA
ncbi:TauD/TfdA family dioxygenase [Streptomyces sp. NPDC090029]|uniref:TauD/TfdA family dioxygenase n=1 Tax=Streptomyces sp. NPDC090029 TaxID=3365924 RepID=UPI0038185A78